MISHTLDNSPRVNLAVCGVFHYRNYVRHLARNGTLLRFYYSHKKATNFKALEISEASAVNFPAKEYLTHLHLRLINHRLGNRLFPIYADLWEWAVKRHWRRDPQANCNVLHTMLHGTRGRLIDYAKHCGVMVLGEPVNSHPVHVQQLMLAEYDRLGLSNSTVKALNTGQRRTAAESCQCDHLLVPSRFIGDSYIRQGFPSERVHVLPWGTSLSQFAPGPNRKKRRGIDAFRVVCVAQLSPRKGHVDLLDAWEQLKLPNAELVLAGKVTPEMEPILRIRRHLFRHVGSVPHARIAELYHTADVVVLPSIEDGFSYVPLEAMACGVPVVVSANAGAAELVEDGVTGFVVPPRNATLLANRLEQLYRNESLRQSMGDMAHRAMNASCGWDAYAQQLTALYGGLIRTRRTQAVAEPDQVQKEVKLAGESTIGVQPSHSERVTRTGK